MSFWRAGVQFCAPVFPVAKKPENMRQIAKKTLFQA